MPALSLGCSSTSAACFIRHPTVAPPPLRQASLAFRIWFCRHLTVAVDEKLSQSPIQI
jgi:hypothetical protein